jgi:Ca2+-binding RTX toxin-like protein
MPVATTDIFGTSQIGVAGEANDDLIVVSSTATTITIQDTGTGGIASAGAPCSPVNPQTVTCPVDTGVGSKPVTYVFAELLGGPDSATSTTASQQVGFDGGAGNDTLAAGLSTGTLNGNEGNDSLTGGDANDRLTGDEGDDTLVGGAGDDILTDGTGLTAPAADSGRDFLDGGPGDDTADYRRRIIDGPDTPLSVSFDDVANDGAAGEGDDVRNVEAAVTGETDDVLIGGDSPNSLVSGPGNDVISGLGGSDDLNGGPGDDSVSGGAGGDDVSCDAGFDAALVDPGDDVDPLCERIGAVAVAGDTVKVNSKGKGKIPVACPALEGAACVGTLSLKVAGSELAAPEFEVAAGSREKVAFKLGKAALKRLTKSGGMLFTTVEARTTEPLGESVRSKQFVIAGKALKR